MNKEGLIKEVQAELGGSVAATSKVIDVVMGAIVTGLLNEGKVVIVGFGSFRKVDRPGRVISNPRNGQPLEVPASATVKFKVGRRLKHIVNN